MRILNSILEMLKKTFCYYDFSKETNSFEQVSLRSEKCDEKLYTEKDMIESAKYGYEYRVTTSFPNKNFEDNCENNFKQHLYYKKARKN